MPVPTPEPVPVRIRHGVEADGLFGFRAMREVNGVRQWIGPWCASDAEAQAHVDAASAALRAVTTERGIPLVDVPNPDIGVWQAQR